MKVKMLETRRYIDSGVHRAYKDEVLDLPDSEARSFVKNGWAIETELNPNRFNELLEELRVARVTREWNAFIEKMDNSPNGKASPITNALQFLENK